MNIVTLFKRLYSERKFLIKLYKELDNMKVEQNYQTFTIEEFIIQDCINTIWNLKETFMCDKDGNKIDDEQLYEDVEEIIQTVEYVIEMVM